MSAEKKLPFSEILDVVLGESELSISVLFRLSDVPPEDFALFEERWPKTNVERRIVLTRHLADLTEENFVVDFVPIFEVCLRDSSADVRLAALDGLWDTTNAKLIRPIIDLMQKDPEIEVRKAAAATLGHYVLLGVWNQIPKRVTERAVEALLKEHNNADTSPEVRRATLEALGSADHPDIPNLIIAAYESQELPNQISAVFAMGTSADPFWLETIFDEMESHSFEMRIEAARAAGEIGDTNALLPLKKLVEHDDYEVQLSAVYAIGKIGGARAKKYLEEWLDDTLLEDLHEAIEEALEEMEDLEKATSLLDVDLDDEDEAWDLPSFR